MIRKLLTPVCLLLLLASCTSQGHMFRYEGTQIEETAAEQLTGTVTEVIDGDTFVVKLATAYVLRGMHLPAGQEIIVRLLLVDTPESVGDKAGMPLDEEASAFAKELLEGETVSLEFDEGEIQDHYDRFLSYAYVDGERVQDKLVKEGYAMIRYIYEPNTKYLDQLRAIEEEARNSEAGIWAIPEYVELEEGFNEITSSETHTELEGLVKEKAEEVGDKIVDEAIDSFFESVLN